MCLGWAANNRWGGHRKTIARVATAREEKTDRNFISHHLVKAIWWLTIAPEVAPELKRNKCNSSLKTNSSSGGLTPATARVFSVVCRYRQTQGTHFLTCCEWKICWLCFCLCYLTINKFVLIKHLISHINWYLTTLVYWAITKHPQKRFGFP